MTRNRINDTGSGAERLLRSDIEVGIVEVRVARLRPQNEGEAAKRAHRAERDRERGQADAGDEDAVQGPERRAGGDDERRRDPDRNAEGGELGEQHRAERERRGERDVDLAEDDDDGEADGEDAGKDELARRIERSGRGSDSRARGRPTTLAAASVSTMSVSSHCGRRCESSRCPGDAPARAKGVADLPRDDHVGGRGERRSPRPE